MNKLKISQIKSLSAGYYAVGIAAFSALFGILAYFSFTQRDALSICIAKFEIATPGELSSTSCSFFGQNISLESISK